jgi:acetamidase/formamidase
MDAVTAVKVAATPQSVKLGFFDASTPPVMQVASGTEVLIETVSGSAADLPTEPGFEILPEHRPIIAAVEQGPGPHLLTGPISVDGAKPGDVLQVDILDVMLRQNWGFNLIIPLLGTIPEDFPDFTRQGRQHRAAAVGRQASLEPVLRRHGRGAAAELGPHHLGDTARHGRQHGQ